MIDLSSLAAAQGQEGARHRHRQRSVDRLGLRQGFPHLRRRPRRHLSERQGQAIRRASGQGGRGAQIFMPLDLQVEGQLEAVFDAIKQKWGKLDICLHSIAFAPKEDLQGRVVDCSKEGFLLAMEISCWSFIRMAKLAEPLMTDGGTLSTMTYYGSQMVVEHYNIMGPVKAALEVGDALSRRRARAQGHQGACNLAGSSQDARGLRHHRLRRADLQRLRPKRRPAAWCRSMTSGSRSPFSR